MKMDSHAEVRCSKKQVNILCCKLGLANIRFHQLLFFFFLLPSYIQLPVATSSLVFLLVNISFLLLKEVLPPVTMLSSTALVSWLISFSLYL